MKTFFFESIYNTQEYALSELSSEPILVISYSQEKVKVHQTEHGLMQTKPWHVHLH